MARCPGDSCVGFEPTGPIWFKVAQYGLEDGLVPANCAYIAFLYYFLLYTRLEKITDTIGTNYSKNRSCTKGPSHKRASSVVY